MSITSRYITGEYHENNPTFHVEDSPWKAGQIQKMLESENVSPIRVAEVGCGAGEILVQLANRYPKSRFDGFELSPQGFALCKPRESDSTKTPPGKSSDRAGKRRRGFRSVLSQIRGPGHGLVGPRDDRQ